MQSILKTFENNDTINKFADKILAANQKRISEQSILNLLLQEQEKTEKAKNNMLSAIEKGIVTNTTKVRLEELEIKQEEIAQKILMEKTKVKIILTKEDITSHIKRALKNQAARIIDLLVKQIILFDDKIEIICNYTGKINTEDSRMNISVFKEQVQIPVPSDKSNFNIENKEIILEIKA